MKTMVAGVSTAGGEAASPNRRPSPRVIAAAVVGALVVVGAFALRDGEPDPTTPPPVELALPVGDTFASCLPVSADLLRTMSPAFAGTVVGVAAAANGSTVTLAVDRWYTGGDAPTVVLKSQSGMEALIDGFDFVEGERYLITATDGLVNFCGFSGAATPELTSLFEAAYGT